VNSKVTSSVKKQDREIPQSRKTSAIFGKDIKVQKRDLQLLKDRLKKAGCLSTVERLKKDLERAPKVDIPTEEEIVSEQGNFSSPR